MAHFVASANMLNDRHWPTQGRFSALRSGPGKKVKLTVEQQLEQLTAGHKEVRAQSGLSKEHIQQQRPAYERCTEALPCNCGLHWRMLTAGLSDSAIT
jgi:hypothetical protein